jgi:hypothetical protein
MIKLIRNNRVMEVCTSVQASAFINNGWEIFTEEKKANVVENKVDTKVDTKKTTPKARVKK